MGIIGAGTGFFLIYLFPLVVNIVYFNIKHPNSEIGDKFLLLNDKTNDTLQEFKDLNKEIKSPFEKLREKIGVSVKPYSTSRIIAFTIMNVILIFFGLFTLLIQFIDINYFGVTYRNS